MKISGYPYEEVPEQFEPFVSDGNKGESDIEYSIDFYEEEPEVSGDVIFAAHRHKMYSDGNVYTKVSFFGDITKNIKYYTVLREGLNDVKVLLPKIFEKQYNMSLMSALMFDYVIIRFGRIVMHASVVELNGEAILFTGHSGIGKSTQANLWATYKKADILNGDRGVLQPLEDKVMVYGSPYAGSSEIYRNESAKVKAIVLLGQSKENSIQRVKGIMAYKLLFPRFSFIRWDKKIFDECMDIVSKIIEIVPVYMLSCYPGPEAVELLYQTIYEEA